MPLNKETKPNQTFHCLGSALPWFECLGESAQPALHTNLHSSLENSPSVIAESVV